jgi:hypothetical protein
MGDPAGEENEGGGEGEIGRRKRHGAGVEEVADVVDRHQNDGEATQRVDRPDSGHSPIIGHALRQYSKFNS